MIKFRSMCMMGFNYLYFRLLQLGLLLVSCAWNAWKRAIVSPIFKDLRTNPNNYRSISVLRVVFNQLYEYLNNNNNLLTES